MTTSFPKDKIRVVLGENVHPHGAELLREEGYSVELVPHALEGDELARVLGDAHLVGIRSKTKITGTDLAVAKRLLAVGCFCIGTNQVDHAEACGLGIPVFNAPFGNTRSVAELTIAEVVALSRRLGDRSAQLHDGKWNKSAKGAHEVRGRTLGIVGYGHIGTQVSLLGEAMGMRVLFFDTTAKLPLGNARKCGSLAELLGAADFVTLHVPEDETTRGMIGADELSAMREGACLLNNARGSIVDLEALAASLRGGRLGGAAVDVFPVEPATNQAEFDSALRGLPNVIMTPHIGGSTAEAQEAIAVDSATKLIRFVNNGSTGGAVNVPEVELPEQPGDGVRPHRILHFHRNVPGVLRQAHTLIADLGANVSGQYLRTNERIGYMVVDVASADGEALLAGLRAIPETVRVRVLW
jgi:D-3-phosphoglycerate dehydrogenase